MDAYQWEFLGGFVVLCVILSFSMNRTPTVDAEPAPKETATAFRTSAAVSLVLLLLIALFPANKHPVHVPWGKSRWAFITAAERIDWGVMALEGVVALVIGGLIWVRKSGR